MKEILFASIFTYRIQCYC